MGLVMKSVHAKTVELAGSGPRPAVAESQLGINMNAPPPLPASTESFSLTYRSTRAANWRCNLYSMFHNKQFMLVTGACTLLLSVSLPLPVLSANSVVNAVLRLIVAVVAMALLNLVVLSLSILKRLPTAKTIRTCTSGLTPEGVRDITPEKPRLLPWRRITEICEHKGDVHVWSGLSGIFIPHDAFKDLEEARRFAQLAVELWRSEGVSWPEVAAERWRST